MVKYSQTRSSTGIHSPNIYQLFYDFEFPYSIPFCNRPLFFSTEIKVFLCWIFEYLRSQTIKTSQFISNVYECVNSSTTRPQVGVTVCNINGRDVQRKTVVNNVDKSSLWAPWQNCSYKTHKTSQNMEYTKTQQTLRNNYFCVFRIFLGFYFQLSIT